MGPGIGVGLGAALTIIGSAGKALWAGSFAAQLGFQLVLAAAQPFLTNAATTLARDCFPSRREPRRAGSPVWLGTWVSS